MRRISGFGPANEYATDQKRQYLVRKQTLHIPMAKIEPPICAGFVCAVNTVDGKAIHLHRAV